MQDTQTSINPIQPREGIKWNEVTWYSKLLSAVFFLLVFPALTFYIGTLYASIPVEFTVEEIPLSVEPKAHAIENSKQLTWEGKWMIGTYGYDVLEISDLRKNSFVFNLVTVGANSHMGQLTGVAILSPNLYKPDSFSASWVDSSPGLNGTCSVDFRLRQDGALEVNVRKELCLDYVGARAAFSNGIYERAEILEKRIVAKIFDTELESKAFLETSIWKNVLSFAENISRISESTEGGIKTRVYKGTSGDYYKYITGAPSYTEYRALIVTKQSCDTCNVKIWVAIIDSTYGKIFEGSNDKDGINPKEIEDWKLEMKVWYEDIQNDGQGAHFRG